MIRNVVYGVFLGIVFFMMLNTVKSAQADEGLGAPGIEHQLTRIANELEKLNNTMQRCK